MYIEQKYIAFVKYLMFKILQSLTKYDIINLVIHMKDFYQIIILTKNHVNNINENYFQINNSVELISNNEIKYNDLIVSFDYLIFDNTNLLSNFHETNILHENQIPTTNFFNATSIENIFSSKDILLTINDIENEEM